MLSEEFAERHPERPADLVESGADLLRTLAHDFEKIFVVVDYSAQVGMFVASRVGKLEENFEMATAQRLGLAQPTRGLQQQCQVVEDNGDLGMVRAISLLVDRQRPPVKRLGFIQPVRSPEELRQVVEVT